MTTKRRNKNIRKTVSAWRKMGLPFSLHWKQIRMSNGALRCIQQVVEDGEYMDFGVFAKRYHYAAYPST